MFTVSLPSYSILTRIAVLAKAALRISMIRENPRLISALAGNRLERLVVLREVALSRILSEKVSVSFATRQEEGWVLGD